MTELRDLFLLDPDVIFLNHGSFGATPRPVFEAYQAWQRKLEHQPVEFLGRQVIDLMAEARTHLAEYLGVDADELVYFPNPTTAINMVARGLEKLLDEYPARAGQTRYQVECPIELNGQGGVWHFFRVEAVDYFGNESTRHSWVIYAMAPPAPPRLEVEDGSVPGTYTFRIA